MRYFRSRDSMEEEVLSLEDLKREFYKLTFEERDGMNFPRYLECCMNYNNGSLVEIREKPEFESLQAEGMYDLMMSATTDEELKTLWNVVEEVLDLNWEDYRTLDDQMALMRYKREEGNK